MGRVPVGGIGTAVGGFGYFVFPVGVEIYGFEWGG